jgi:hypothetical protein
VFGAWRGAGSVRPGVAGAEFPAKEEHRELFFEPPRGAIAFLEKSCFCPEMAGFNEWRLSFRLRADGL